MNSKLKTQNSELRSELVFIALGSNLGDSSALIREAIERLQKFSDVPVLQSSFWQTTPVDCPPDSPLFVNAVVGLVPRAEESPESLLAKLQTLEKEFGRQPKKNINAPRPLDLDLIAFKNIKCSSENLILPHPRAHLRRFVLQPLAETAPDLLLPGQKQSVSELLESLKSDEQLRRIEP